MLSSIVTILLARLSETQFLVRVNVADLWGAIAIGFIASASGTAILQKYFLHQEESTPNRFANWVRSRRRKKAGLEDDDYIKTEEAYIKTDKSEEDA